MSKFCFGFGIVTGLQGYRVGDGGIGPSREGGGLVCTRWTLLDSDEDLVRERLLEVYKCEKDGGP